MMTPLKLKRLLEKHPQKELLEGISFKYTDPLEHEDLVINGFSNIYTFFHDNERAWVRIKENFQKVLNFPDFKKAHDRHQLCYQELIRLIEQLHNIEDQASYHKVFDHSQLQSNLNAFSGFMQVTLPEVTFMADLFNRNGAMEVTGALTYYKYHNHNNFHTSQPKFLKGYFLAMQFENQEEFKLVLKKETYYDKYRAEIEKIEQYREDFIESNESIFKSHNEKFEDLIKENNVLLDEYVRQFQKLKEQEEKTFKDLDDRFNNLYKSSTDKIINLEDAYGEKLTFEEPAKLWGNRAKESFFRAHMLMVAFISVILCFSFSLYQILVNTPDGIFLSFLDGKDRSAAVRWSIVFISFLSFGAFGLRAILKAMFSAYHISRDNRERHALTLFYLSLLKSGNIEKDQRSMVMQSLFSRSDTGLLKDDNGPTMPTEIKAFTGKA